MASSSPSFTFQGRLAWTTCCAQLHTAHSSDPRPSGSQSTRRHLTQCLYLWSVDAFEKRQKNEHTSYRQRVTTAELMSMQCIISLKGWSGHLLFAHAAVIPAFVMPDTHTQTNKWMERVIARLCCSFGAEMEVFLMRAITMSERNCGPEQNNNADGS